MAHDVANRINYYLAIDGHRPDDLARIRHWSNIKVAYEGDIAWIKDLDYAQVNSVEVRSLPAKTIYYEKNGRLFKLNNLLPERIVPSLLWTQIDRALRVTLPSANHNFFGLNDRLTVKLIESETERDSQAMLVEIAVLRNYVESAPSFRLAKIRWTLLNGEKALLLGKPFLPIPGNVFWSRKDMLIPIGCDFQLPILSDAIQKIVNPGRDQWLVWSPDASYRAVPKEEFQTLSRSSLRLTHTELSKEGQS